MFATGANDLAAFRANARIASIGPNGELSDQRG
jgi:hypothetical protein